MGLHAHFSPHTAALAPHFCTFFGPATILRPAPAPADESGHKDAPAPRFVRAGWGTHEV